ncbi:MAG: hypothetical protein WBP56_25395 [Polyangia bacterium]
MMNIETGTKAPRRTKPGIRRKLRRYKGYKAQARPHPGTPGDSKDKTDPSKGLKELELSSTMAGEFIATMAAYTRVTGALKAKVRGTVCESHPDWPTILIAGCLSQLRSPQELATAFSVEDLSEMQENLRAALARHLVAHKRGYGDALRSNRQRQQARTIYRMTKGQTVLTQRHINGERVPPNEEVLWSKNKTDKLVQGLLSLADESCARAQLKPLSWRNRFYVYESEPRVDKSYSTT